MKINITSPLNNYCNFSANKLNNKNQKTNINKNTSNVLLKNSLAEAIGRSQVSFCGENRIKGSVFEHSCNEFLGDKENIFYNKEDGSFKHQIISRDGIIKKQEEFFPLQNKEIITKVTDGIKTVTTKTDSSIQVEKFNAEGKQIYFEVSDNVGNKKTVETDYKKNIEIITRESYGKKDVQVIDLTTKESLSSGDLVLKRIFNKDENAFNTINIVTGQILKTEKYRDNNTLHTIIEYSETTGNPVKKVFYNDKTGCEQETLYDESGIRKQITKTSYDKRNIEEFEFESDGNTVKTHIESQYDKKGHLKSEISYIPGTSLIDTYSKYNADNCTVFQYRQSPNVPKTAKCYEDGNLVEEIKFQFDGKNYEYSKEYKNDGSYDEKFYNKNGYETHSKSYNANNFMYLYVQYDDKTGEVSKIIEIDENNGDKIESCFDKETGYVKKLIKSDFNGKVKEVTDFYRDSEIPKSKREYHNDGSFTYSKYNEEGKKIFQDEYNADGSRKNAQNSSNTQRTKTTSSANNSRSLEDIIDSVLQKVSSNDANFNDIKPSDWAIIAKELGFKTPSDLFSMDNKTYKSLCKKYHPDLQTDETKDTSEKIFKLVNNIYSRMNK